MSGGAPRILLLLLIAGVMTTCLSLYMSATTRKYATELSSRGNSQQRLRHTLEAVKGNRGDVPNLDFRLVIHGTTGIKASKLHAFI